MEYVTCKVFKTKAAEEHSLPRVNMKMKQKINKSRLYREPINCNGVNARKNIIYKDTSLLACYGVSILKY
jgi:hypothetical protein